MKIIDFFKKRRMEKERIETIKNCSWYRNNGIHRWVMSDVSLICRCGICGKLYIEHKKQYGGEYNFEGL